MRALARYADLISFTEALRPTPRIFGGEQRAARRAAAVGRTTRSAAADGVHQVTW